MSQSEAHYYCMLCGNELVKWTMPDGTDVLKCPDHYYIIPIPPDWPGDK